jgi:hypothetical protein
VAAEEGRFEIPRAGRESTQACGLGTQDSYCFYDPASNAAVGAWRTSALPDFCNETSYEIFYGVAQPGQDFLADIEGGPRCPGAGECHAPLAESSCPATWQEVQTDPVLCRRPAGFVQLGHAGGFLTLRSGGNLGSENCYYDPVTLALVGEWQTTDVPSFCDQTSYDILYGDALIGGLPFKNDLGAPSCPDGGA